MFVNGHMTVLIGTEESTANSEYGQPVNPQLARIREGHLSFTS